MGDDHIFQIRSNKTTYAIVSTLSESDFSELDSNLRKFGEKYDKSAYLDPGEFKERNSTKLIGGLLSFLMIALPILLMLTKYGLLYSTLLWLLLLATLFYLLIGIAKIEI
ncbi:MAG: hypothetical protein KDD33_06895, partial [Bdellovibrionales bacterium]|nr:hypothetical protein [Bdellovibrionales bacterium]